MATVLGVSNLMRLTTPTGVDAGRVWENTVLKEGMTAGEILTAAATILGTWNQVAYDRYSRLFNLTEELSFFQPTGATSRSMTPKQTEYGLPRVKRTEEVGGMWPIVSYDDALGWTEKWLRKARRQQAINDLERIGEDFLNRVDYQMVLRMLYNTEYAIGSGYDVPWAIGTGTNVNFVPKQYLGTLFASTHSHFNALDKDSNTFADLFELQLADHRHHGVRGRLTSWVSGDDLDEIMALEKFVELKPADLLANFGSANLQDFMAAGEFEGIPGELAGFYRSKRYGLSAVFEHERFPQGYVFTAQPGSPGSATNPLALRVDEDGPGFGLSLRPIVTRDMPARFETLWVETEFGVGVNDRLGGVAGQLVSGASTWSNPNIT